MSPKVPADLACEAFYARATGDSEITFLVGHSESDERITWARPQDVIGANADTPGATYWPALTYFSPTDRELAKDTGVVRVQTDIWVWPQGEDGGIARLKEIDGRLYEFFHKTDWTHEGRRFFCRDTDRRDWPPEGDESLLRRTRELMIGVGA